MGVERDSRDISTILQTIPEAVAIMNVRISALLVAVSAADCEQYFLFSTPTPILQLTADLEAEPSPAKTCKPFFNKFPRLADIT